MPDPWTNPDIQPDSTLQAMITRLEERGQHEGFAMMIQKYASKLPVDRPLRVLDLGCGTGVVVRHLVKVLHPDSVLHGADVSEGLLKEARRLAPGARISWDHVASELLPYEEECFDAVVMHTLLSHVSAPLSLLTEVKRVLKKGGTLIVFDADHAGTTYGQHDYETTRRMDFLLTSAIATHPDICRCLPRLLKEAGYKLRDHDGNLISECGKGDYWLSSVRGFERMMPSIKAVSPEEAKTWVEHMMRSHEENTFFASGAFYTFYASREI